MPSEFDRFALAGYSELLRDPIRDKFAARAAFFVERKLILITGFFSKSNLETKYKTWLDVGCGEGALLALGKNHFKEIAGCDISLGMIQACPGLPVREQSAVHKLPFEDSSFDFVTAVCVYHHVQLGDRQLLTADISRVLKPEGVFCLIEHNPYNPLTQIIVGRCPVDKNANLLKPKAARQLALEFGMQPIATKYFLFLPERIFSKMGWIENLLSHLPLGGQYAVFCRKSNAAPAAPRSIASQEP